MESTEATTSCTPSSPRGGYNGGNDLSLSLYTVMLYSHTTTKEMLNKKNINFFCPKSYLYTYDFRAIYIYGPEGAQ